MELRVIGMPIRALRSEISQIAFVFLPFELYWQLLTYRMFQVQVYRLAWEDFVTITNEYGRLEILGLGVEEDNPWTGKIPFHFGAGAFGVSTKTVEEALQYYWNNFSDRAREVAPASTTLG